MFDQGKGLLVPRPSELRVNELSTSLSSFFSSGLEEIESTENMVFVVFSACHYNFEMRSSPVVCGLADQTLDSWVW